MIQIQMVKHYYRNGHQQWFKTVIKTVLKPLLIIGSINIGYRTVVDM
jgi:hypothetical protein